MAEVQFTISEKMIEEVMAEWEAEHPGQDPKRMGASEFADRMMVKIKGTKAEGASNTSVLREGP